MSANLSPRVEKKNCALRQFSWSIYEMKEKNYFRLIIVYP